MSELCRCETPSQEGTGGENFPNDDVFAVLRRHDVRLPKHVELILISLGYDNLRSISMIDITAIDALEKNVKTMLGGEKKCAKMSQEDRVALFSEQYADRPKQFKFLPGQRCALLSAIKVAGKLIWKRDQQIEYEDYIGQKRKRRLSVEYYASDQPAAKIFQASSLDEHARNAITWENGNHNNHNSQIEGAMPLFSISTSVSKSAIPSNFLKETSSFIAKFLGKPESNCVVTVVPDQMIIFGGEEGPCAIANLRSIDKLGLEENKVFSKVLCELVEKHLGILQNRMYIEFQPA